MVREQAGRIGVDVVDAERGLDLLKADLGGVNRLFGLVHLEVLVEHEVRHDAGELVVGVGRARARARDDERRSRLVDEDGVDLVDDGEVVAALHAGGSPRDHVVAQIIEAELGVRAVGDVGLVGGNLLRGAHAVLDQADLHAEEAVDLAHPLGVAAGEVIVHGDDMDVVARKRVQIARKGGHERLAFARLHLCNLPIV